MNKRNKRNYKRTLLSIILCIALITGNLSSVMVAYATDSDSTDSLSYTKVNYMTDSQYEQLFGKTITDPEQFSEEYAENPLEGYQPYILQELYFGQMNTGKNNSYSGDFAIMENVSSSSDINLGSMRENTIGGVQDYYRENSDTYTQAINTIAVTPGKMSEDMASLKQQIIVEARLYTQEDEDGLFGWFYEDDTYVKLQTYTLKDDNTYARVDCVTEYAGDSHWAWDLLDAEQQGMLAMATGDYDNDEENEVAVYMTSSNSIVVYGLKASGDGYKLENEFSVSLSTIDSRFGAVDQTNRTVINLSTTSIAGVDELVICASMPYLDGSKWCGNSNLSIWNFQNGEASKQFSNDLTYYSNANSRYERFKMPASVAADLNGDGTDELVVGGFKNYGYSSSDKGSYSLTEYLVNVVLYEDGEYSLAWSVPQELSVGDGQQVWHDEDYYHAESPVAMAAGRYAQVKIYDSATNAVSSADTLFLEGVFAHFQFGAGDDLAEQIEAGAFSIISSYDHQGEDDGGGERVYFNIGASGAFASDEPGQEQLIFTAGVVTNNGYNLDVDVVCAHANENGNVNSITTEVIADNYVDTHDGYQSGPVLVFTPVNVDNDSYYVKYTGRTVGWSNPSVCAVLYSMPYWDELYYGSNWTSHGDSSFTISGSSSSSHDTNQSAGVSLGISLSVSSKVAAVTGGIGGGVSVMASRAQSFQEGTTTSESMTFTTPAGTDKLAVVANPIVVYEYELLKQGETEGEKIACTQTLNPVYTSIDADEYNKIIKEFNATATEEDKLETVNLDEIYPGAEPGDPASYSSSIEYIEDQVGTIEGSTVTMLEDGQVQYPEEGSWASVQQGDYAVGLSIGQETNTSVQTGYTTGLTASAKQSIGVELDVVVASFSGEAEFEETIDLSAGESWTSTSADGMSFAGTVSSIPASLTSEEAARYSYGVGLAKWETSIDGIDKTSSDESGMKDTTIVMAPLVFLGDDTLVPDLPNDIHVVTTTKSKAVLEWTNPEGARAPEQYAVYYALDEDETFEPVKDSDGNALIVSGEKTGCVVDGLTEDTTYYFKLKSIKADGDATVESALSYSVLAKTKTESNGPTITEPPTNCYANVGEVASFSIKAEAHDAENTLSYQWQKLEMDVNGNSWVDISGATEETYLAGSGEDGVLTEVDAEELQGAVYRCVVKEYQSGGNSYEKVISKTARLYIGDYDQQMQNVEVTYTGSNVIETTETEIIQLSSDPIEAEVTITDESGNAISNKAVIVTVWDETNAKVAAYQTVTTNDEGKADVFIDSVETAGKYSIIAGTLGTEDYLPGISESIYLELYGASYPITYVLNGGTNAAKNPEYYYPDAGILQLEAATRKGYDFTGWYFDEELTQPVENNQIQLTEEELDDELVLYAGWEIIYYDISYELDGSENDSENPTSYTVEDTITLNNPTKDGAYFAGWYTDSSYSNQIETIAAGTTGDLTLYANWEEVEFDFDEDFNFILRTYDDLVKMAELVNSGNSVYQKGHYIVANDIECPTDTQWTTPIGYAATPFSGTLDGQGYAIKGLWHENTNSFESYFGLFGYIDGAVIKNLNLEDVNINISGRYSSSTGECSLNAAALCGSANNALIKDCSISGYTKIGAAVNSGVFCAKALNTTISRCINTSELNTGADNYTGPFAGYCNNVNLSNCANLGQITIKGYTKYASGIACGSGLVENCYNAGSFETSYSKGSYAPISFANVENCYYLDDEGTLTGSGTAKTTEEFASGEVTYLLNKAVTDGNQNWYQNLDNGLTPDAYPVLDSNGQNTVYQKIDGVTYTNLNEAENYEPLEPNEEGVYEISSYEDLVTMAMMVRLEPEKYAAETYSQTTNINCGMETWDLAIGTEDAPFEGTYEGNGYYIMALRPTASVSGLFGVIGEQGRVESLSVFDFDYEEAADIAGGLAGINRGVIDDCGSGINLESAAMIFRDGTAVPIKTLDSSIQANTCAGGLVAINYGTIFNSRNSADVTAETGVAGGLAGENYGVIANVYQTGTISGDIAGGIAGKNSGVLYYGYSSTVVEGNTVGAIAGTSETTYIQDMFYVADMSQACSNQEDSAFVNVSAKTTAELKSQATADELNQFVADIDELYDWTYSATENEGYPKLKSDDTVTALRDNVQYVNPEDEPATQPDADENAGGDAETKPDADVENQAGADVEEQTQETGDAVETGDAAETGDSNLILPYVGLLMAAIMCLAVFWKKRGNH